MIIILEGSYQCVLFEIAHFYYNVSKCEFVVFCPILIPIFYILHIIVCSYLKSEVFIDRTLLSLGTHAGFTVCIYMCACAHLCSRELVKLK